MWNHSLLLLRDLLLTGKIENLIEWQNSRKAYKKQNLVFERYKFYLIFLYIGNIIRCQESCHVLISTLKSLPYCALKPSTRHASSTFVYIRITIFQFLLDLPRVSWFNFKTILVRSRYETYYKERKNESDFFYSFWGLFLVTAFILTETTTK